MTDKEKLAVIDLSDLVMALQVELPEETRLRYHNRIIGIVANAEECIKEDEKLVSSVNRLPQVEAELKKAKELLEEAWEWVTSERVAERIDQFLKERQ